MDASAGPARKNGGGWHSHRATTEPGHMTAHVAGHLLGHAAHACVQRTEGGADADGGGIRRTIRTPIMQARYQRGFAKNLPKTHPDGLRIPGLRRIVACV